MQRKPPKASSRNLTPCPYFEKCHQYNPAPCVDVVGQGRCVASNAPSGPHSKALGLSDGLSGSGMITASAIEGIVFTLQKILAMLSVLAFDDTVACWHYPKKLHSRRT
eukprot:952473-Amphidinium_carterae.1